ncbi:hypothetical protein V5799_003677 [Amblyomma americanum]|uniref:Uncharacterized protein n=1 Tax=Amblyomma americanum TaxID=6943 RepID=A0AAQ4D8A0_AMBAM
MEPPTFTQILVNRVLKKDGPPKLKTSCTPGRLTVGGNATSSPALSSTARAAIVALKKENGMLRHNISVLYKTAKQLLDSRDKEIVSLQRRLDNLVFKRNLGSQNSPHAAATATSARDLQQRSQRQSHSPWNSSGTSSVRSPHGPSAEKRNDCPDPTAPAMPKVDMSGDLQRLYEYNNTQGPKAPPPQPGVKIHASQVAGAFLSPTSPASSNGKARIFAFSTQACKEFSKAAFSWKTREPHISR